MLIPHPKIEHEHEDARHFSVRSPWTVETAPAVVDSILGLSGRVEMTQPMGHDGNGRFTRLAFAMTHPF